MTPQGLTYVVSFCLPDVPTANVKIVTNINGSTTQQQNNNSSILGENLSTSMIIDHTNLHELKWNLMSNSPYKFVFSGENGISSKNAYVHLLHTRDKISLVLKDVRQSGKIYFSPTIIIIGWQIMWEKFKIGCRYLCIQICVFSWKFWSLFPHFTLRMRIKSYPEYTTTFTYTCGLFCHENKTRNYCT